MSVSQETLDMITAAIKKGDNIQGSLVRSKLTNRLVWHTGENCENDPYGEYLSLIGAAKGKLQKKPESEQVLGGRAVLGENQACADPVPGRSARKIGNKHDLENWRDQWENLKKAGYFCGLCKNNKEGR